jgi:hypothetical protein
MASRGLIVVCPSPSLAQAASFIKKLYFSVASRRPTQQAFFKAENKEEYGSGIKSLSRTNETACSLLVRR